MAILQAVDEIEERWWECPSCHRQLKTRTRKKHNGAPKHQCPQVRGIWVPFVEVFNNHGLPASAARHRVQPRDDYEGSEVGLERDESGRPISAVHVDKDDGSNDAVVFVATATNRRD